MTYQQKNYYNVAKKTVVNGRVYDSKFEGGYAMHLESEKRKGNIKEFETHKKLELKVNGYLVCNYYIDFIIYHSDGTIEYAETKGHQTPAFRIKWKLFEALYSDRPGVKISLIMQKSVWRAKRASSSKAGLKR